VLYELGTLTWIGTDCGLTTDLPQILQVLVFCVPFYNFLDQVRQRTVQKMESDTPLVDAMIMFMREFNVLASAESSDALRMQLTQQQLEQYGKSVTPQYVYDAIAKLDRFNSMRVSQYGFDSRL
jgi:ubiquitin carboxyl-terminal hydrolase 10